MLRRVTTRPLRPSAPGWNECVACAAMLGGRIARFSFRLLAGVNISLGSAEDGPLRLQLGSRIQKSRNPPGVPVAEIAHFEFSENPS